MPVDKNQWYNRIETCGQVTGVRTGPNKKTGEIGTTLNVVTEGEEIFISDVPIDVKHVREGENYILVCEVKKFQGAKNHGRLVSIKPVPTAAATTK